MRRLLLSFTMLATLSGCTAFAPRTDSPAAVAPRAFPRTVRLVRTDSTRITLFQARLEADTIRGEAANGVAMKVATKDVARWEARRFDFENSAVATLVVVALGSVIWDVLKPEIIEMSNPNGAVLRTP